MGSKDSRKLCVEATLSILNDILIYVYIYIEPKMKGIEDELAKLKETLIRYYLVDSESFQFMPYF